MVIKYRQHIPAFFDGFTPKEKDFNNLAELLDYNKRWLINNDRTLCFACGSDNMLMISSITDEWWWVLGYVNGIDLKEYLPYFKDCYIKTEVKNNGNN